MMKIGKKHLVAGVIAILVMVVWYNVRIQRAKEAAELLGMIQFDYTTDTTGTDKYDASKWDGYDTGTGMPPWVTY